LEFTAVGAAEFFAASGLLLEAAGCVFDNHPALLDSTETEKATAARMATPTISSEADFLDFFNWEFLRKLRIRWIKPGSWVLRGM
jgi:hypothetical protein